MTITRFHTPLVVGSQSYDLSHLTPVESVLIGEGRDNADIRVRVSFQSHVYTKSCKRGDRIDHRDEGGKPRSFSPDRYELSRGLAALCQQSIAENWLAWESKDRNRVSHYMTVEAGNGNTYAIIYRLAPSLSEYFDVYFIVKSAYEKTSISKNMRKYNVRQLIKKCYYDESGLP